MAQLVSVIAISIEVLTGYAKNLDHMPIRSQQLWVLHGEVRMRVEVANPNMGEEETIYQTISKC